MKFIEVEAMVKNCRGSCPVGIQKEMICDRVAEQVDEFSYAVAGGKLIIRGGESH